MMETLAVILIVGLVASGIYAITQGNAGGGAGTDDPIVDMIEAADDAAPVTSASWRDRRGNRGRFRRDDRRPAPAPAAITIANGGPVAPAPAGGGWWPFAAPPAAAHPPTLEVDEVTAAPAAGGLATYSLWVAPAAGAAGAVTFVVTGLPAGATWAVAPAPFVAPRGGNLGINFPGGPRPPNATLVAVIGGVAVSATFPIT